MDNLNKLVGKTISGTLRFFENNCCDTTEVVLYFSDGTSVIFATSYNYSGIDLELIDAQSIIANLKNIYNPKVCDSRIALFDHNRLENLRSDNLIPNKQCEKIIKLENEIISKYLGDLKKTKDVTQIILSKKIQELDSDNMLFKDKVFSIMEFSLLS